jgi:excinuclease ABC subunit A
MKFLPDAAVPCAACRGRRFRRLTLGVRFKGRNVAEILAMRIDEAVEFFSEIERIHRLLSVYQTIGLGYLSLGQSASTFSGGEAQRVRLAAELAELSGQHTLYILDEPTAGLHPADVCRLLAVLKQLVAAGNSVIVVEHSLQMMQAADWLIDLGPDSGASGGRLVFTGPPQQMISKGQGYTADALRNAWRQNLL